MKIIERRDHNLGHAVGEIGTPGRSFKFFTRRLRCPNCHSILETEPGEGYEHLMLADLSSKGQRVVWLGECPNCKYDKLAYLDKNGN